MVRTYEKEETMDVLVGTLWLIAIFAIVDGGAIFMIWFPRQRLTVREASRCFFALALIKSAVLALSLSACPTLQEVSSAPLTAPTYRSSPGSSSTSPSERSSLAKRAVRQQLVGQPLHGSEGVDLFNDNINEFVRHVNHF